MYLGQKQSFVLTKVDVRATFGTGDGVLLGGSDAGHGRSMSDMVARRMTGQ